MQLTYHEHGMLCEFTLMTIGEYQGSSATPAPANDRNGLRATSEQHPSRQGSRQPSMQPSGPPTHQITAHLQTPEQRKIASMLPPIEPASRSSARDVQSQRPHRPTPPPPKASIDPGSLFIPADDEEDDRVWGERSFDDEQDVLGWNPHANTVGLNVLKKGHVLIPDCRSRSVKASIAFDKTKMDPPNLVQLALGRQVVRCVSLQLRDYQM